VPKTYNMHPIKGMQRKSQPSNEMGPNSPEIKAPSPGHQKKKKRGGTQSDDQIYYMGLAKGLLIENEHPEKQPQSGKGGKRANLGKRIKSTSRD